MPVKAKFKMAGCPLKKWHPIYTEKELDEWEMRLNSLNGRANADQQRWIEETILKISGVARKINNCPPCLKSMVDDIGRFIKESRRNVASCEKKSEESLEK